MQTLFTFSSQPQIPLPPCDCNFPGKFLEDVSLKHKSVNCANFHFVDFLNISCFFCFSSGFISCFFHSSSVFAVFLASVCSTSLLILCAICTIHSLLTLFQIARHVLLCLPFSYILDTLCPSVLSCSSFSGCTCVI